MEISMEFQDQSLPQLTLWQEDSPANQSALLDGGRPKKMPVGSGRNSSESFAWYDPDSSSWRTRQACVLPERSKSTANGEMHQGLQWERFLEAWPKAGMTRNGQAYQRALSVPTTFGSECLLLPTLTVNGNYNRAGSSPTSGDGLATAIARQAAPTLRASDAERGGRGDLIQFARGNPNSHYRMPTLAARDAETGGANNPDRRRANGRSVSVHDVVYHEAKRASLPTLTSRDWRSGKNKSCWNNSRPLNEVLLPTLKANRWSGLQSHGENAMLGPLNPEWCEWYMGFPIGWTELEPSEMQSSPKSQNSSGTASEDSQESEAA
jgi:hypothetical protein